MRDHSFNAFFLIVILHNPFPSSRLWRSAMFLRFSLLRECLSSFISFSVTPFVFSAVQLPDRGRPHLSNASDQEALLGFMSATAYDTYQSLHTSWKPNVSLCEWTGVICSRRRQRVVSLNVSNMGLQGTISPFLANLSFLRILDLHNNKFHGHIPYQLGSLFRLKMLRMSLNQWGGSIPPTLCGCCNLQIFSMAYNNLTRKIPTELCVLPRLQHNNLYENNLTGTIPACLGNISTLHYIDLGSNNLHGFVPPELGILSQVIVISMFHASDPL